jgi:glycosyltransferase involved in cell wall biosynthesis
MKIIIVSYAFPPIKHISSTRPLKLAKYFLASGHSVTIITSIPNKNEFQEDYDFKIQGLLNLEIIRIKYPEYGLIDIIKYVKIYIWQLCSIVNSKKKGDNKIKYNVGSKPINRSITSSLIMTLSGIINSYRWFRKTKKYVKRNKSIFINVDLIITTTPIIGTIFIGKYLKHLAQKSQWMVDFRDSPFLPMIMDKYSITVIRYILKSYLKQATFLTVVSEGIKESISNNYKKNAKLLPPIHVVYNGYDIDDIKHLNFQNKIDNRIRISYTGTLYSGKRNPELLFDAIREIERKNLLQNYIFEIHYAGEESKIFQEIVNQYQLSTIVIDHGNITKQQSLSLQSDSDLLLLLTWNTKSERGIITGKFPEMLLFDKKIIALVTGDDNNSEIEIIINKFKLGYVGYYLDYQQSKDNLVLFILNFVKNRYTNDHLTNQMESIKPFDYKYISRQILNLYSLYITEK